LRIKQSFQILIIIFLFAPSLFAASMTKDVTDSRDVKKDWVVLPYAFYTESLDLAYGLAGGTSGYGQEQMGTFGALMGTANDSYGFYFAVLETQIPGTERLFLNTYGSFAWYTDYREYIVGNTNFPLERGGSNDSSEENFLQGEGWDNFLELKFRYVLPIGMGKDNIINLYRTDRGILAEGSTFRGMWNPLESGRTYLEVMPFAHWQSFESEFRTFDEYNTNGLELALKYDNTDFYVNPSLGSSQRVSIMRDFGWGNSSSSWTAVEAEASKYFSLGENSFFRQQVLALDFWTAYSPTWESEGEGIDTVIRNRPPDYYGATLGGFYRMRAFPRKRFHDKAAVYYSVEYRVMPHWQPIPDVKWLRPFEIDWWQFVLFAEAGRVAPEWNVSTLHEDMKTDVGFSLRMMIMKAVGRLDFAFSDESFSATVLIGHPF
jgi:hypothetical protein